MQHLMHSFVAVLGSSFGSVAAFAQEVEEHARPMHITPGDSKRLIYHSIDLIILFGGLYYLGAAKIKTFFAGRGKKFEQAVKEAQRSREEAEHHNIQIKMKLKKLEETATDSVEKAEQQAQEMKASMIAEARKAAERVAQESDSTIKLEFDRATLKLKNEVAAESVEQARKNLKSTIDDEGQLKLEREFIENIQVR